jgi:hypothetical protein
LKPLLPKVRIRAFRKDISIPLLTPYSGTFHFHMNKEYFMGLLNLNTEDLYNNYISQSNKTHSTNYKSTSI